MDLPGPLLMVGCGKMGGALLAGWLERGVPPSSVVVVEPAAAIREGLECKGVRLAAGAEALEGLEPAVLVLAVKPQVMAQALREVAPMIRRDTLVVSIAAGTPVGAFEATLGSVPVVRVMPNTPAAIGRGISALYATPRVDEAGRRLAEALMRAAGEVVWVEDEALMHAVTAVSGSGPAYVFHMVEALAKAGEGQGLPADLAMRLARATVAGAGALLDAADEEAATLRANVTSPGGTTAAALTVLMGDDGLPPLMARAVEAAAFRSRELAKDNA